MNNDIWVYMDLRSERLLGASLNVLSKARELAHGLAGKAVAVLAGTGTDPSGPAVKSPATCVTMDQGAQTSIAHGADWVYVLAHELLAQPRADRHAWAIAEAIESRTPRLVLWALSDLGREIAARVAVARQSGLIADCADLRADKAGLVADCPSWGGEIIAELTFQDTTRTGLATVQPHAFKAREQNGAPGRIEHLKIGNVPETPECALVSREPEPAEHRRLEAAETVVVGGAGMGDAEGFFLVRQLAAALGGEVGATRPPVMRHWVDEDRMIGQTGRSVHPNLLISAGTSGAIQYTSGISAAKTIVAVNRDPNAPIFQLADIGVVADARVFLPYVTQHVKQLVLRQLTDDACGPGPVRQTGGIGDKIRKLREAHTWSVAQLAQKTGQSPEVIDQVESGQTAPSVSFMLQLARAMAVDPGTFLRDEEKTAFQDRRSRDFVKRTRNYSYQTLTPDAENLHLRAFMVTIESRQAHKPVAYKHEGEEFVYVVAGDLELTLGAEIHLLTPGDCMHFNSEIPHKLKSRSAEDTRCLVVLYTI